MTTSRNAAGPLGRTEAATLRGLTRGRVLTRDLADELLTHLPDVGDLMTQRVLDDWVERAADSLRAVSEAMEERLIDLGSGTGIGGEPTHSGAPQSHPEPTRGRP